MIDALNWEEFKKTAFNPKAGEGTQSLNYIFIVFTGMMRRFRYQFEKRM
jgi:hypothetical protein